MPAARDLRLGEDASTAIHLARGSIDRQRLSNNHVIDQCDRLFEQATERVAAHPIAKALGWDPRITTINKTAIISMFDAWAKPAGITHAAAARELASASSFTFLNDHLVLASSGSSGKPSLHLFNADDRRMMLAGAFRRLEFAGALDYALNQPQSFAWMYSHSPIHGSAWIGQSLSQLPNVSVDDLSAELNTRALIARLQETQPQVLAGYASKIVPLAKAAINCNATIRPASVVTSGELLTPGGRQVIEEAFGVNPRSLFGMTEGIFAAECAHNTMHLFIDLGRIDLEQVASNAAQSNYITVSSLFRIAQPILRMVTADSLTVSGLDCACGSPFPAISNIDGRSATSFSLAAPGGARQVPLVELLSVLDLQLEVQEFRVRAHGGLLLIELAMADVSDFAAHASRIATAVAVELVAHGVTQRPIVTPMMEPAERTYSGKKVY